MGIAREKARHGGEGGLEGWPGQRQTSGGSVLGAGGAAFGRWWLAAQGGGG